MKRIAVLTGAGISAESGLSTFRGAGALWEGYRVDEVASIQGWLSDKRKVLDFYNLRRRASFLATPNFAHLELKRLESYYEVHIITQNVDLLHEQAGSTNVLHLHGRLDQAKSDRDFSYVKFIGVNDIKIGDTCPGGHQLRPDIVLFGEDVPNLHCAAELIKKSDALLIIGTSLSVYPAANLVYYIEEGNPIIIVDPSASNLKHTASVICIDEKATVGTTRAISLIQQLLQ